jgi:molecular chaperone HscB
VADHFEILGIPRGFRVDERELENRYRELSRLLHPDRHAARSAAERRLALEKMIEVNDAYRTLREPVRRAAYLLSLRGLEVGETDGSNHLPPGFLLEVMERREAFDEARARRDRERVSALAEAARKERAEALDALGRAFDRDDDREAAAQVSILRYLDRFLSDVRAWEDQVFEEENG